MPRQADAASMFARWTQDPQVTRYLTWRPHHSPLDAEDFVEAAIAAWATDARAPYVIATRAEEDTPIGVIEVRFASVFAVEVGYVLQRGDWNRGYMTEAARAVLDALFALPEVWRVYAYCDVENIGSARVMERAGMQHEGTLRRAMLHPNVSDAPRDVHLYARVR
jgi:RimJ/RimL family protein N-acetyltransferase